MRKAVLFFFICVILIAAFSGTVVSAAPSAKVTVPGKAAYLCDWHSGECLFAQDAYAHLPIASMCKIMTLLLCFEEMDSGMQADEEVCISEQASGMGGSQVFLEAGGVYKVGDLIESICIASANDACVAMAERISGEESLFVEKMNQRAEQLGMRDTFFINCTGLPEPGQYSCAKDVALMLSALMRHPDYFSYSKIWMDTLHHAGGRVTEMANTNKMIRSYQGCDAGKTGYTADAGFCLAASAARGSMRVVAVVIGAADSKTRFDGVKNLFDYAFSVYTNKIVLEEGVIDGVLCPVIGGKKREVCVRPEECCFVLCKKGDADSLFYKVELQEVHAPLRQGDRVGWVIVYKNNVEVYRVRALSNEDSARRGYFDSVREIAQNWVI